MSPEQRQHGLKQLHALRQIHERRAERERQAADAVVQQRLQSALAAEHAVQAAVLRRQEHDRGLLQRARGVSGDQLLAGAAYHQRLGQAVQARQQEQVQAQQKCREAEQLAAQARQRWWEQHRRSDSLAEQLRVVKRELAVQAELRTECETDDLPAPKAPAFSGLRQPQ
jgi:hypothetical protein